MRLLAFTPTWKGALRAETRASIEAQRVLGELDWVIGEDNPFPIGDMRNVVHQYQHGRDLMLQGGYDGLVTIEHDMVLPDWQAVQRMAETDADVIYGVYLFRRSANLNAFRYENDRELGMPLSLYPQDIERAKAAKVWRISGVGMGCTLFRRHTLQRLHFKGYLGEMKNTAPDIPFAEDALHAGYYSVARFDVLCGHFRDDKLLIPGQEHMAKLRCIALETVRAYSDGQDFELIAGQEAFLSPEQAEDLARVGYVKIADDAVAAVPAVVEHAVEPEHETAVAPAQKKRKAR